MHHDSRESPLSFWRLRRLWGFTLKAVEVKINVLWCITQQVKVWSMLSGSLRPFVEALMMVLSPSKWKIRIRNPTVCENVTADYVEVVVTVISDVDIARRAATVAKGKWEKPASIQCRSCRGQVHVMFDNLSKRFVDFLRVLILATVGTRLLL